MPLTYLSIWLQAAIVLLLVTTLILLAAERQMQSIRLVALQGAVLGLMPALVAMESATLSKFAEPGLASAGAVGALPGGLSWGILGVTSLFFFLKGLALPFILKRTHDNLPPQPPSNPYLGHKYCIVLGLCAFAFSLWMGSKLDVTGNPLFNVFFAPAFAVIFSGLIITISRRTALNQVIGYLVLENGIYLLGVPLAGHDAVWIELSTLLDVCVAVFVMGIAIYRISTAFESTDVGHMALLKD